MDLKDFITNTTNATKAKIISLVNYQLTNEEKKQRLDDYINDYLEIMIERLNLNFILKFILKKYLIPSIPIITQSVFDLLKERIEGITK